jgi:hypothetical protein
VIQRKKEVDGDLFIPGSITVLGGINSSAYRKTVTTLARTEGRTETIELELSGVQIEETRYRRYPTQPPTPTGADPADWIRTIPVGSDTLWYTTCYKNTKGEIVTTWFEPQQATGENGTSPTTYWLVTDIAAFVRATDGSFSPASALGFAMSQTGAANPAAYSGRFVIADTTNGDDWTDRYTSQTDESSKVWFAAPGITGLRFRLYLAGGTTTLLSESHIPVVESGQPGADGPPGSDIGGRYLGLGCTEIFGGDSELVQMKVVTVNESIYELADAASAIAMTNDWIFDTTAKVFLLWDGLSWGPGGINSGHRVVAQEDLGKLLRVAGFVSLPDVVSFLDAVVTNDLFASAIKAGSIEADKLAVSALEAMVAMISQYLIIDSALGFGAQQAAGNFEGNIRAYLNEAMVAFEQFFSGSWRPVARLSTDGLLSPQVYNPGPLVISNNTPAGRRSNESDLGLKYPTGAKLYHLDGNVLDQYGVSYWAVTGTPVYDYANVAVNAVAPYSPDKGAMRDARLQKTAVTGIVSGSWWVDFWVEALEVEGDLFTLANTGYTLSVTLASLKYIYTLQGVETYEYTTIQDETYEYIDPPPEGNLSLGLTRPGSSFVQRLNVDGWTHIAVGFNFATNVLSFVVGQSVYTHSGWNQGGAESWTVSINPSQAAILFDEVMVAIGAAIVTATAQSAATLRIPWAGRDYTERKLVIDAANPDDISQNLVRSGSGANGEWTKLPDGTLICRAKMAVTSTASTWTFPEPFASGTVPEVTGTIQGLAAYFRLNTVPTATTASIMSSSATSATAHVMAIGRWK